MLRLRRFVVCGALTAVACAPGVGCATAGLSKVVAELAKDPATVSMTIIHPYGSVRWYRTNPQGQAVAIGHDGSVDIQARPAPKFSPVPLPPKIAKPYPFPPRRD